MTPELELHWLPNGSLVAVVHIGHEEYSVTVQAWEVGGPNKQMKPVPKVRAA